MTHKRRWALVNVGWRRHLLDTATVIRVFGCMREYVHWCFASEPWAHLASGRLSNI